MKHATLHLLSGLLCLSSASIAVAGANTPDQPGGPIGFDHGVPVFELPAVVVTPKPGRSARFARKDSRHPTTRRSNDNPMANARPISVGDHDSPAQYTAVRVVER